MCAARGVLWGMFVKNHSHRVIQRENAGVVFIVYIFCSAKLRSQAT